MKKILHLNLYRKYFDAISNGTKTIEYRKKTDYWKKRIEDRDYDIMMGFLAISVSIRLIGNLISDLTYALVDPRIRFK